MIISYLVLAVDDNQFGVVTLTEVTWMDFVDPRELVAFSRILERGG